MSEKEIEQAIQAAGKTAARVTLDQIDKAIALEYYFTAKDAVKNTEPDDFRYFSGEKQLGLLTFCVLILKNGFTVTGESACASPENFDEAIGRRIAKDNARQKIWPLEGYLLRQKLADAA
jgi:hypothetical protein